MASRKLDVDLIGETKTIFKYMIQDMKKKPGSFQIGIFSIFLVIGFLVSIQSAFQLAPLIFLNISENSVGDTDLIITPVAFENDTRLANGNSANKGPLSTIRLLNSTEIDEALLRIPDIAVGATPRWIFTGRTFKQSDINGYKSRCYVLIINSRKERSLGLGRRSRLKELDADEAYVSNSILRALDVKLNQRIALNIDLIRTFILQGNFIQLDLPKNISKAENEEEYNYIVNEVVAQSLIKLIPEDQQKDFVFNKKLITKYTQMFVNTADGLRNPFIRAGFQYTLFQNIDQYIGNSSNQDTIHQLVQGALKNDEQLYQFAVKLDQRANYLPQDYVLTPEQLALTLAPVIIKSLNFTNQYIVKEGVEVPKGKWAESIGNVISIDSEGVLRALYLNFGENIRANAKQSPGIQADPLVGEFIEFFFESKLNETVLGKVNQINIDEFAVTSNIVLKNRQDIYYDKDVIQSQMISSTNSLYHILGQEHPSQPTAPLAGAMNAILLLQLFLDNMVASAIFLLTMLATLLIYSLMISDVEEKTYEFGMLRALGLQQQSLIILLLLEGLSFAIPGLSLGLVMAYIINGGLSNIIFSYAQIVTSYQLHWSSIVLGIGLGVIIPICSNYFPIKRALSKTLRDSLDLFHRATNEINVTVMKLEKLGISFNQFVCAITLIFMGVLCYYFAPRAFIYQNIRLFLFIINMILILMIIGYTLLLNMLQPYMEKFWLWVCLQIYQQDEHLQIVIVKNMQGHQRRNSKTALMYTTALAFLIFAGAGFKLQSQTIQDFLKSQVGTDIMINAPRFQNSGLDEKNFREYLEFYKKRFPDHIRDYTFVSIGIQSYPFMKKPQISPLCQFPIRKLNVVAVEQNFMNAVYHDFYNPNQFDSSFTSWKQLDTGQKDCISGLYSNEGHSIQRAGLDYRNIISNSDMLYNKLPVTVEGEQKGSTPQDLEINLVLPEGLRDELSFDTQSKAVILLEDAKLRVQIRAMVTQLPNFFFSGYRTVAFYALGVISMKQYQTLIDAQFPHVFQGDYFINTMNKFYESIPEGTTHGIPQSRLLIQFAKYLQIDERQVLTNGLRNFFQNDQTFLIDVPFLIEASNSTLFFIDLFYVCVSMISIILSFFLILVSFVSNVREHSWEFGVLRAVGLNKSQITRVFMYEAFVLTLSAGIIGTFIGIMIAITLTLQFLMFTELPFRFIFPTNIFIATFALGILTSLGGSYAAIKRFREKSISSIIKGTI